MAAAADRHLLFGLLALQTGLIDQARLVAAFQAWTREKSKTLAEHLESRGDLTSDKRGILEALADVHVKSHGGEVEKSLLAVPANRRTLANLSQLREPELEVTLARVTQSAHGHATKADNDADPDRAILQPSHCATSDGQRFRILRPHARGGLGAVFVALDAELNREVALKQILENHADDPQSRKRFVAEAEITGGLEHPGVVPVYALGAYEDGRPFYAMRFIKGESLKEAIDRFHQRENTKSPSPFAGEAQGGGTPQRPTASRDLDLRKLLRRFLDACNAIDYAHSRGVIHRDLKPANIILGKHGETHVVDWGLAKSVGRADPTSGEQTIAPSSSGSSETRPGSALGTPAYMSPEQARGDLDRLGPRSDVYSLGATLYCLLIGKPPFEGEDIAAILHEVQEGFFQKPSHHEITLDRALEAICLKAMATKPDDRYSTAKALADDLERWMADEPVAAWYEPWNRRLARWLSRHRAAVTGAAAAMLVGVLGLSAVLAVQSVANARLAGSLERETNANKQLKNSKAAVQARYDLAVEAIETFHTGVSEDFLLRENNFKELRDRLLKSASDFYGKLGALLGKETDLASRSALAQSNFELAELTRRVGRLEAALAAHRAVLAAREALAAESEALLTAKVDVGRSMTAVASLLEVTGKTDEALSTFRRSESLLSRLATSDRAARAALAACRNHIGQLLFAAGRTADGLAAYRLARADQETLAAAPEASNDVRRDLADTLIKLSAMLSERKPVEAEAESEAREAMAIYQKLVDANPGVTTFRAGLASTHRCLHFVLADRGQTNEAEAQCRAALTIEQKLVNDNPAVRRFRINLAGTHFDLGLMLTWTGRPADAESEFRAALELFQKLADENSSAPALGKWPASVRDALSVVLSQLGRLPEAEAECRKSRALWQKLADDNPAVTTYHDGLASALIHLGDVLRSLARFAEAGICYEQASALAEARFQADPTNMVHRFTVFCSIWRRGISARDLDNPDKAAADIRRALEFYDETSMTSGWELFEAACGHAALAGLAGHARSPVSAADGTVEAAIAMDCLHRAVARGYRNLNELRIESALDPLRSREDFRSLLMDMAIPADPFAARP